jgi:hypothetical protein
VDFEGPMKGDIERAYCGPDGKPDLEKMRALLTDRDKANRLDTIGWALFFIWVGIAWLANLGTGMALLGIGVVTLGTQLLRKIVGVPVNVFWLVVGFLLVIGAVWDLLAVRLAFVPLLLIGVGVVLLIGVWRSRPSQ